MDYEEQMRIARELRAKRFKMQSEEEKKIEEEKRAIEAKKAREQYLKDKYSKLIVLDYIQRSAARIQSFVKRYVFKTTYINNEKIPGIFRKRMPITELNLLDSETQKLIDETSPIDMFNDDDMNADIRDILKESLKDSIKKTTNYPIIGYVMVDMRLYGNIPELQFYIQELNQQCTFTHDQQSYLKHLWNKINPETIDGLRFNQMIDASKELVLLFNQIV